MVRSVLVECCCLKPCWTGEMGMACLILLRTNFSRSFDRDDSNEMGLYDEGMLGGLLGFKMGIIWDIFQVDGILLLSQEKLKIAVIALRAF